MVTSSLPLRKTSSRFLSGFLTVYYLLEGLLTFFIPESWKQKDVKGQIVLITGGGSGIGQLTAINFLKLGAKVVIWDVSKDGMDKTVEMMRNAQLNTNNVFCYKINLCDRNSIYETAKRVQQDVGVVDILINNAGVVSGKTFLDIPDEKIELTMNVNTMAHFWTCKAFLPDMVKRNKGHIVTVASVAGNVAGCHMSDYHASKFANVGFDMALRMELAQAGLDGIKTSIVKPYFITTGMFSGVRTDLIPFLKPEYVAEKIVSGIRAENTDIVIPYYFMHFFWLIILFPAKCLVPMSDFLGGFEFMSHFEGREGQKSEINNNSFGKNGINNNTETKKAN